MRRSYLCEMEDRLLQEEIAMARLNPSSEDTLNEYLNSDGQVLLLICYYKYNPCVLNLIKKRV